MFLSFRTELSVDEDLLKILVVYTSAIMLVLLILSSIFGIEETSTGIGHIVKYMVEKSIILVVFFLVLAFVIFIFLVIMATDKRKYIKTSIENFCKFFKITNEILD
jgi:hypothetical protein